MDIYNILKSLENIEKKALTESAEPKKAMIAESSTVRRALASVSSDLDEFSRTGQVSDDLYNAAFDYYSKTGEMPYEAAKAKTVDPYEWVANQLHKDLGLNEVTDAELDAQALAQHKARLARDRNRRDMTAPGAPAVDRSRVPAAVRKARGEEELSYRELGETEGKEIDYKSLEIDGIDYNDAPDFVDAYFSDGYYTDGTPLSDADLEELSNDYDLVHQYVQDRLYEGDMEEGNAFSGAVAKAKADGVQPGETITVGGKEYPVKEGKKAKPDFLDVDKDGNKKEPMKKAVADKKAGKVEESGQLDEISKKTLGSYINRASKDAAMSSHWSGRDSKLKSKAGKDSVAKQDNIAAKRIGGIEKATARLTKESVASGDKKPYPKTWHDVAPKLGKQVAKMSPEEKVKKGYANPSILKKKSVSEGVDIVKQDYDLDQMVFVLNVDGNKVSFTYWDYEDDFKNPDIKDIYQQAKEQLGGKLSPEQIKAVARSVFKSFGQGMAEGVAEVSEDSFIQKLGSRLQQLGYAMSQEGNVYRWTRNEQFVEVEPDTESPGWYGWAEGQVTRGGKLRYGDSGNDGAKDIVSIFKDGGVFRKQGVAEASLKQRVKTTLRKLDPTIKGRLKDRADDEFDFGLEKEEGDWISGAPGSAHMKRAAHLRRIAAGEKPFQDHEGIKEGAPAGMVRFVLDSERAYQAVMDRYGHAIEWDDNEYMMVPERIWPKVQEVAYEADGIGAENVDDGVTEGSEEEFTYPAGQLEKVVARLNKIGGFARKHPDPDTQMEIAREVAKYMRRGMDFNRATPLGIADWNEANDYGKNVVSQLQKMGVKPWGASKQQKVGESSVFDTDTTGYTKADMDFINHEINQIKKIHAKLLNIPGVAKNVKDEAAQLKLAEKIFNQMKRGHTFDSALVLVQKNPNQQNVAESKIKQKSKTQELDEAWPGTPEYELRFGKPDSASAFDKKKISTGTVYTRKHKEEPEADDSDTPKKKGRPAGSRRALGAKGPSGNSKLLKGKKGLKEQDIEIQDRGEYDREGDMALNQVHQIADAVKELHSILDADANLPEWVQSKITKALDYIDTARDYLDAENDQSHEKVAEKAPPGAKAERMVKHIKKGYAKDGKLTDKEKSIAYATAWKAKKAGKVEEVDTDEADARKTTPSGKKDQEKVFTKHKERMKQIDKEKPAKKKEVEETTVAGSVATADAAPKKAKGGMEFGKGVYEGAIAESFEKKLGQVLNESTNLTVNVDDQGQKSVSVSATGADADHLSDLLKMAGLFSSEGYSRACQDCGGIHEAGACSSEQVDEELANAPDEKYADADYMLNDLSGGLNGPKSTGQTTGPIVNRQDARQGVLAKMDEATESTKSRLWSLYKEIGK